ncbi:MAG TPA: prepilin-type N-terminal cleavage/methylation domain-containing protein [Verrucomicrobia bacterium]|nr:prepilin-type N-terminal cleavage/methylation domain-containing protein [Verrucomicrobiota bacterium]
MSIDRTRQRGWTLVEMMVTVAIFSIASLALATLFLFSVRSFAAMANYAELDQQNREAMDRLTREIRQAREVTSFSTNPPTITILNGDSETVTYSFDPFLRQLRRTAGGVSEIMLTNCNLLNFHLYQRNPSNANYGVYPVASGNWQSSVKVIELTWKTSKTLNPSTRINSENVQTARIVIRKQQDN